MKLSKDCFKNKIECAVHVWGSPVAIAANAHMSYCLENIIYVEDKSVQGVRINGQDISCKSVVSNSNIVTTIEQLVGQEKFDPEYIKDVKNVRLNNSSCQVYMGIKKGEKIPHVGDLLFSSEADEYCTEKILSKDITSRTFSFYYPEIRPGTDRYSIVSSTNARYKDWANLSEKEYLHDKNHLEQTTLDALDKYIPGIRKKVDHVEASTPKTFKRYTLHPSGTSFGTKFEGLQVSRDLPKQIKGLFHAGSVGIIMSGWLGAANYGVIVANETDKFLRELSPNLVTV